MQFSAVGWHHAFNVSEYMVIHTSSILCTTYRDIHIALKFCTGAVFNVHAQCQGFTLEQLFNVLAQYPSYTLGQLSAVVLNIQKCVVLMSL